MFDRAETRDLLLANGFVTPQMVGEPQLDLPGITQLSLTIVPNKGGSGIASLTSLQLFAWAD
jgi:hypothetical protein